jgi:hypothetical protein
MLAASHETDRFARQGARTLIGVGLVKQSEIDMPTNIESSVVERCVAWAARYRREARDYERLSRTLAGFNFVAFACLMLARAGRMMAESS